MARFTADPPGRAGSTGAGTAPPAVPPEYHKTLNRLKNRDEKGLLGAVTRYMVQ